MKLSWPKSKKSKIIFFASAGGILIIGCTIAITLLLLSRVDYALVENPTYEINTENNIATLFSQINSGTLENGDMILDTTEIGEKSQEITIASQLGTKQTFVVTYNVIDATPPTITGDNELVLEANSEIDILGYYQAEDNSKQEVALTIDGDYDLTQAGDYTIRVVAKDQSSNEATKEVTLKITEPPRAIHTVSSKYYIEVNRQQNVVIVYLQDQNGNNSDIVKVFVASTGAPGSETPLGVYTTSDKYDTLYLVGDVWGHYAVRIDGPFFFHSVPYFTKGAPWDNLEYLEYNKLGNGASAGCVRLAAADAKWIYDNIGYGTTVKIYDSDTLPSGVVKPTAIKIDENSPNRGWDPTDPDPDNPWH